ncbi:PREDICTED: uncharacterized protein LOC106743693 [Dinoponera quadriceps]|uniref:Uncharacterized protein LOC106743693 n=1 Tax=Dinoponera quadriceps TaxID=609295 RepID=A0A6P3X4N2_DINQU|nr:PREDICTED: uncharacterized protein LOC106743693 [Dinoponera quadriceps]
MRAHQGAKRFRTPYLQRTARERQARPEITEGRRRVRMSRTSYYAADTRMVVVVTIVVMLCYPTVIDTAAVVKTEIFDQHLQNIVLHGPRNMRVLRSAEGSEKSDQRRICYNLPCAWEVYDPYTRNSEYTIKNDCVCPDNSYKCVRSNDVLSASAYSYHCRQNTTADDIEYSKDAN